MGTDLGDKRGLGRVNLTLDYKILIVPVPRDPRASRSNVCCRLSISESQSVTNPSSSLARGSRGQKKGFWSWVAISEFSWLIIAPSLIIEVEGGSSGDHHFIPLLGSSLHPAVLTTTSAPLCTSGLWPVAETPFSGAFWVQRVLPCS